MKKGCFIIVFVILTVIIGAGIYMYKNHKEDVLALFKPMILDSISDEFNEAIEKKNISANKDSLKNVVNEFLETARNTSKFRLEQIERFSTQLYLAINDGVVDSTEITQLKNLFEEEKENERSEKNRN